MKGIKLTAAICLLLAMLSLAGCGNRQKFVRGEVMAVSSGGDGFLLNTGDETLLVRWEEDVLLGSWLAGSEGSQILDGSLKEPSVMVFGKKQLGKEPFGGDDYPVYQAEQIFLEAVWQEDAYILTDGTRLDLRRSDDWKTYYTKEGRPLLREDRPVGPHNVAVGNMPSFDQLGEEAQKNITAWYDGRGLGYDLDAELERAWKDYQTYEEPLLFQEYHLSQEIFPSAYNGELVWFSASVLTTISRRNGTENRTCQAFRRATGEPVPVEALFRSGKEEVLEALLDAALPEGNDREELRRAFQMEWLNFGRERLELWFPAGSLPSEEHAWILSVQYEDIKDLLWTWAIPESPTES